MKNTLKLFCIFSLIAVIGILFIACPPDNGGDSNTATVTSVNIHPGEFQNLLKGSSLDYTATVIGSNNPSQTVIWSIDEPGKHANTNINTIGKLTIASDETLTQLTIRATSDFDNSKSNTTIVKIFGNTSEIHVPNLIPNNWYTLNHYEWFDVYNEILSEIDFDNFDGSLPDDIFWAMVFMNQNINLLSNTSKQMWENIIYKNTFGINLNNWPQDNDMNHYGIGMHYRKSNDGLAMAINPAGRGGTPDIFVLIDDGNQGTFPVGTWSGGEIEFLIITNDTIIFKSIYFGENVRSYTLTSNQFTITGFAINDSNPIFSGTNIDGHLETPPAGILLSRKFTYIENENKSAIFYTFPEFAAVYDYFTITYSTSVIDYGTNDFMDFVSDIYDVPTNGNGCKVIIIDNKEGGSSNPLNWTHIDTGVEGGQYRTLQGTGSLTFPLSLFNDGLKFQVDNRSGKESDFFTMNIHSIVFHNNGSEYNPNGQD